ncbi:MAG: hypothetical protein HY445_00100 [Candidatus Niyogibacteria bacterium]|nr:hypothetical protein [Candidatus Niyogibacteria bacterium]
MKKMPFKPELFIKTLLSNVPARSREILERRYGIGKTGKKETLEAIGKDHKITRERVRQIENHALGKIRDALNAPEIKAAFEFLENAVREEGTLVGEDAFLDDVTEKSSQKNDVLFLLALGKQFAYIREDDAFHARWATDDTGRKTIETALINFSKNLHDHPLSEKDAYARFCQHLGKEFPPATLTSWLAISKRIAKNPFGEWGPADSAHIRPRGIRDLAYLFMRKHGSPLHFREVADGIKSTLNHPAHHQTVHNELIKDNRFVLVGRGLYALTEWGYQPGIVRNVIQAVIKKHGALSRAELVKHVLKERHVKENTIVINLQNRKYFQKLPNDKYSLV